VSTSGDGHRSRILVADDDAALREVYAEFLGAHGFEVLQAGNGLEALLQVKHKRPHVVLLDLDMPRLGGAETLKRIRAFDAGIKVVVITGVTDAAAHARVSEMGAVAVLSKPVLLPELLIALRPSPTSTATAARTPPARESDAISLQILVVDDDAEVRTVFSDYLTLHGHQVQAVADAASALRVLAAAAPDVVLLDIDMPGLTGVESLPAIRALAPTTIVIMVSGTDDSEVATRALAKGAFDYVTKPVDFQYLRTALQAAAAMRGMGPGPE
jgi:CheY-like chemotaxis protein